MTDAADFIACWIIVSACAFEAMKAAWVLDFARVLHIIGVLSAFVVAIVGAHVMGQHLWAG
jgi:hypothetical protein